MKKLIKSMAGKVWEYIASSPNFNFMFSKPKSVWDEIQYRIWYIWTHWE